jgi:hypothetical protein
VTAPDVPAGAMRQESDVLRGAVEVPPADVGPDDDVKPCTAADCCGAPAGVVHQRHT